MRKLLRVKLRPRYIFFPFAPHARIRPRREIKEKFLYILAHAYLRRQMRSS